MTRLWEVSNDLVELKSLIDDILESDLTEDEKQARLNYIFNEYLTLDSEFEQKAEAVGDYILELEAKAKARKERAKLLEEQAKQAENQAKGLRQYLTAHLRKHGKTKIDGTLVKLLLKRKPPNVCLNCDVDQLPEQFQRVKIEANLTAIKDYLKVNPSCKFAFLSNGDEYSLTIK